MKQAWWLPVIIWAAFFALYTATTAPSIVELFDDSLEFQLVAPTFGIAHPTGYPLYVIAGGLWSRVLFPFGNWAWRMNLFSALAAACTVALVFVLAQHLARLVNGQSNLWAGLAAACTFGLGPIWGAQATVAEVYALHNLFVAALLYFGFRVLDFEGCSSSPAPLAQISPPSNGRMLLLCATAGLGLAHHRTIVFALPVVALYLFWNSQWIRRLSRAWVGWLMALATPLLLYLWLPLRAAQGIRDLHGSYTNTWTGFWNHVLATGYTGFFDANFLMEGQSISGLLALWRQQMGVVAMLVGGSALVLTLVSGNNIEKDAVKQIYPPTAERMQNSPWRKLLANPWFYVFLFLITNVLFVVTYRVADAEVFLLPALLSFALFTGGGVAFLGHWFRRWPRAALVVQALCVLILALGVGGRGPLVHRGEDWATHDYAVAMAKVDFPLGSHVVALEGEATALQYMQRAEGLGHNATPVVADEPAQRRQIVARLVGQGTPTYLTRELEGIERQYSFSGEGPLVRVWPRGQAQAGSPMHLVEASFANGNLRLEGYDLVKLDQAGGQAVQIAFFWHPTAPLSQTLKISLRLHDLNGAAVLWPDGRPVQSDHYPLRLVAKTSDWLPGEVIRDVHELGIPAAHQDRALWLHVILYDEQSLVEAGAWQVPIHP